tara:strand:+ start:325 stop:507 length:183 start_codon:yes stop_codon:yes gene_type:complete
MSDISIKDNKSTADDNVKSAEFNWNFILEQLGKPRWNGNPKSKFSLINSNLKRDRRKKRL